MPNWKKVIVSGSDATLNSLNVVSGSTITGSLTVLGTVSTTVFSANADTLVFSGSIFTSGSFSATGSLSVNGGITGSLLGTASYATTASYWSGSITNALSASYASTATSASYALNATSASYALNATSASYSLTSTSASYANNANSSSYALTASFALNGGGGGTSALYILDEGITQGSASYLDFVGAGVTATVTNGTASINIAGGGGGGVIGQNAILSQSLAAATWSFTHNLGTQFPVFTVFDSSNNVIIPQQIYAQNTSSALIYFSTARSGTAVAALGGGIVSSSYALVAVSASYASASTSASYALNATTASYALTSTSASFASNAAQAQTSSYVVTAQTASFVTTAQTASYVLNAVSASYALTASFSLNSSTTGSFTGSFTGSLLGTASRADNATSASYANNATTSSYSLLATSASYASASTSASYATNALTASYALVAAAGGFPYTGSAQITGSLGVTGSVNATLGFTGSLFGTASYATNALTASYLSGYVSPFPFTGSAIISGSLTVTGSILQSGSFTSTGTITAQTLVIQTITSSIVYSSGSNIFGNSLANTQVLTGSVTITGSLAVNGSNVILTNQTSSMSVATASFVTLAQTASFVQTAQTASFVTTAQTASFVTTAQTASFVTLAQTASFVQNAQTASYALVATSASYASASTSASYATNALTASYALVATSASYAATASFVTTAQTASYVLQAVSASYATFAVSASNAPGFTVQFTQSVAAATWSFTHNMNTRNPIVQVYDSSYKQIIPNDIIGTGVNTAEIRFDYSQSGYVVMSNGGGLYVTGSTSELVQTVGATTWSFTHNLNSKYVAFEVYDSNDYVIIPAGIKVLTTNTAELYFAGSQTGRAVAQFSGINGAPNATTASYALTATSASYALNTTTASYALNATTASYALTATSASFASTASYLNPIVSSYVVLTQVSQSLNFVDDAAAAAGGIPLGGLYRNGNFILIRIS